MFDLDKIVVGDVETDALDGYTKVHCVVFNTMDGTEYVFEEPTRLPWVQKELKEFLHEYRTVAGHHFIQFDYDALQTLLPGVLTDQKILDTLVMSRLINYSRKGGHSIAAIGEAFGIKKEGKDIKDFSVYTEEMLARCKSDVKINLRELQNQMRFLKDPEWERAIEIEHFVEWQAREMRRNGLEFDIGINEGQENFDKFQRHWSALRSEGLLAPIGERLLGFPKSEREWARGYDFDQQEDSENGPAGREEGFDVQRDQVRIQDAHGAPEGTGGMVSVPVSGRKHSLSGALGLYDELIGRLTPIDEALQSAFPPAEKEIKYVTPTYTKAGTLHSKDFRWASNYDFEYRKDEGKVVLGDRIDSRIPDLSDFDGTPFSLVELIPFNPGSPSQIVSRLNDAGWKPTEKTKGHLEHIKNRRFWKGTKDEYATRLHDFQTTGWKVSETNLLTLPDSAPVAARQLAERITIASRVSDVEEWLGLVANDGRLHPYLSGIGAWTHRMAHSKPNSANIPVAKRSDRDSAFQKWVNDINDRMRALFIAGSGKRLLGTDADGIQMRIFAHLVGDERLISALVSGDKSKGTDIHSVHQRALGSVCKSRDAAKTFIYAFLLGAGIGKVAEILECTQSQAKEAVNNFLDFYPGLKELKQNKIPRDAARGYFIGLDGRKVICDSEHLMLSGYLQNGEKIIMSYALREWIAKLEGLELEFSLINWVHDEWQTLIPDDNDLAKQVTDIQIQALRDTTEILKLKCPMEGTTSKHKLADGSWFYGGYSWMETH